MRDRVLSVIGAVFVAILFTSFVAALPEPFCHIHLPLLLILLHVNALRFDHAVITAVAAGVTMDLLSVHPFGSMTAVLLIVTGLLIPLFTHVFTNRSLTAFVGLNIVGFAAYRMMSLLVNTARFWLNAYPLGILYAPARLAGFFAALATHVIIGAAAFYAVRALKSRFGSVILVR